MPTHPDLLQGVLWSCLTILFYLGNRVLYLRTRAWWLSPIFASPAVLCVFAIATHTDYQRYIHGTHWLVQFLGPVTVAFALPIYRHRELIRRNSLYLAAGIVVGCLVAVVSSLGFAMLLHLDRTIRLSIIPRSMSTPFAMAVSTRIGGSPGLTAVFTAITGVAGVALGDLILKLLRFKSTFARGAIFGMGAHGAGVARAQQLGAQEASSAGLVMVLVGVLSVVASPMLAILLRLLHIS